MVLANVDAGFVAVLGFVFVFALVACAVWSDKQKGKEPKKMAWEQREPSAQGKMQIVLIIAAVLLVCIILAAIGK